MNLSQCRPTGGPTIFSTSRLCQRLVQPKSGFDLTDPNGYKLPSLYSNLNDPNLRTYFHRKDIHDHLRTNGFITKDDKVICSMKEFNKYMDHLAEVQLDWDHSFRAEQKELVRMVLSMQSDGKLSSDVPIADVMEWILFEGRDMATQELHKDKDRPERQLRTRACSRTKLPKIHTQTALSYPDSRSDQVRPKRNQAIPRNPEENINISDQIARSRLKAWRSKGCNMLKQVITEVQREMRLETLKSKASKEERDKKKQGECKRWTAEKRLLERVAEMSSHLTNVRDTVLQEEQIRSLTCIDQGVKQTTFTKLKPLPNIKKQGERKGRMAESVAEMSDHLTNVRNTVLQEEQIRSLTCIDQGVKQTTFTKLKPLSNIKKQGERKGRMAESVAEMSDHLTNVRNTVLQEEQIRSLTCIDQGVKQTTFTKLKPLSNIKRHSGFDENMAKYASKDASISLPTNIIPSPKVEQSSNHFHAILQHTKREVDQMEGQSKTSVPADCFFSTVGNIGTLVVKEVNGPLSPAMQRFESGPAMKKNSDGDLHTRLSSPTLSDIAVDLINDVLNELKMTW